MFLFTSQVEEPFILAAHISFIWVSHTLRSELATVVELQKFEAIKTATHLSAFSRKKPTKMNDSFEIVH